jgi:MvaI/BcnI restriction endonuclease family
MSVEIGDFITTVEDLKSRFSQHNVIQILVKVLAPNDNSKNQPYVAKGDLKAFNFLPVGVLREETTDRGNVTVKGPLRFSWLTSDGTLSNAPHTQLIFYPQYPEVRLSGFLKGARAAPTNLMNARQGGRILFLGITSERSVVGYATSGESSLRQSLRNIDDLERLGVFGILSIQDNPNESSRAKLLRELSRINRLGWINSKSLRANGTIVPCNSPQCVGYTLEAELGIARNGRSGPDIFGWEVKAGVVSSLARPFGSKPVTLITPEPNSGFYKTEGKIAFVRRYGYADRNGVLDRLNFGGVHKAGTRHAGTQLELVIDGFDSAKGRITNAGGTIGLVDLEGNVAAAWSFAHLMNLWSTKHAFAAYIAAEQAKGADRKYKYGEKVLLGEGTDFLFFLKALSAQKMYYDPAIKLENASAGNAVLKPRSQFRMKSSDLGILYSKSEIVTL